MLENYDPEFGVIVAGTLDPEVALPLAVDFELERQGYDPADEDEDTRASIEWAREWMGREPRPRWLRIVPAPVDHIDGYTWMIWGAREGARGAFKAVEFRR